MRRGTREGTQRVCVRRGICEKGYIGEGVYVRRGIYEKGCM